MFVRMAYYSHMHLKYQTITGNSKHVSTWKNEIKFNKKTCNKLRGNCWAMTSRKKWPASFTEQTAWGKEELYVSKYFTTTHQSHNRPFHNYVIFWNLRKVILSYLCSKPQFPWHKDDAEQNNLNCFLICSPAQARKSEGCLPNIWQEGHKEPEVFMKKQGGAGDTRLWSIPKSWNTVKQ